MNERSDIQTDRQKRERDQTDNGQVSERLDRQADKREKDQTDR